MKDEKLIKLILDNQAQTLNKIEEMIPPSYKDRVYEALNGSINNLNKQIRGLEDNLEQNRKRQNQIEDYYERTYNLYSRISEEQSKIINLIMELIQFNLMRVDNQTLSINDMCEIFGKSRVTIWRWSVRVDAKDSVNLQKQGKTKSMTKSRIYEDMNENKFKYYGEGEQGAVFKLSDIIGALNENVKPGGMTVRQMKKCVFDWMKKKGILYDGQNPFLEAIKEEVYES